MTPPMLAAVMTPGLLYAGLAAASIPIIIHLLSKRRFRRIRWAAIDWLLEADRQNRRRVRLEELLLLALRCLAMFVIGAMLARVFLRPQTLMAVLGSTARTERVIVLDNSFSMGVRAAASGGNGQDLPRDQQTSGPAIAREGDTGAIVRMGTVFERGKAAADRLVQWLRREAPGDPLTVVVTSSPDRPIRSEAASGGMDLATWGEELKALEPSSRAGNFAGTFAAIKSVLESKKSTSANVYVISDFQRIDWGRSRGEAQQRDAETRGRGDVGNGARADGDPGKARQGVGNSLLAPLAEWAGADDIRHALRVVFMDVGAAARSNLTLAAIEPQQAQAIAGVGGNYSARITNHGDSDSAATSMHVFVGSAAQPAVAVPVIPANRSVEVPFEATFPNESAETLTIELEPDALTADNTRSLVVPVVRAMRVLVVNGEPATDTYQDEVFLLDVALRPEGPQFSGNEVTVVDENEFEATDLSSFHLVVLANVHHATEDIAARLEEYVTAGGGVAIFLGDQVDPDVYNRVLYRDGKGLLPGRLGESVAQERGVAFGEIEGAHPAMRRFRDAQVSFFQGVVAYRYVQCEPVTAATQPASLEREPSTRPREQDARPPAQVLMRLADNERSPLLVERSLGAGKVAMLTTSVDKEWTNLPERPAYVVLAMELTQYLARAAAAGGGQLVGEPIRLSLEPGKIRNTATLKLPGYPQEPLVHLEAQPELAAGVPTLYWVRTEQPGVYQFTLLDSAGGEEPRPVAVNVDTREGDLHRAGRAALLEAAAGLNATYVAGEALAKQDGETRRELWPALLIVLVGLLMSEQALAWWFGSDRRLAGLWRRN